MNKNEILSSAMAEEQINKLNARKNEIADSMTEKRASFEESDVETRDALIEDVENLQKEAEQIDKDIEELEEQRAKFKEQEERMSLVKTVSPATVEERKEKVMENTEVRNTPEFVHAWREAVMSGNEQNLRTLFTTLKTDEPAGTVPVPTYVQSRVEAAWERLSILNGVSISNLKGIIAVPYEASTTGAVIHAEGAEAPAEEQLVIGQVLLQPVTLKKWIRVSSEVEALSDQEFMDYVVDEIIYQINLLAESMVIEAIKESSLTANVDTALTFNSINEALAQLNVDDPVVIMSRATFFSSFMGLTDLQQRPIYQISADNTGRPQYFINGLRVLFNNNVNSYAGATEGDVWAYVGDLRAVRANFPNGRIPTILYDPYTEAEADLSKYVGKLMMACAVVRPDSWAKLTVPEA